MYAYVHFLRAIAREKSLDFGPSSWPNPTKKIPPTMTSPISWTNRDMTMPGGIFFGSVVKKSAFPIRPVLVKIGLALKRMHSWHQHANEKPRPEALLIVKNSSWKLIELGLWSAPPRGIRTRGVAWPRPVECYTCNIAKSTGGWRLVHFYVALRRSVTVTNCWRQDHELCVAYMLCCSMQRLRRLW